MMLIRKFMRMPQMNANSEFAFIRSIRDYS
jgi:hypothetical protein